MLFSLSCPSRPLDLKLRMDMESENHSEYEEQYKITTITWHETCLATVALIIRSKGNVSVLNDTFTREEFSIIHI